MPQPPMKPAAIQLPTRWMLTIAMSCIALALVSVVSLGCEQRVIGRQGIGAEESHPNVSQREEEDRVSKWLWPDQN